MFPVQIIHEIFSGVTLRDIIRNDAQRVRIAAVDDEGVVLDMDTKEDYRAIIEKVMSGGNQQST
jgi:CTP:molybdopterin cytidylyltransferase MocA